MDACRAHQLHDVLAQRGIHVDVAHPVLHPDQFLSLDDLFATDRDTLRVYRRWLVSRGARDAELLIRRGIIPFAPKKTSVQ